MSLSTVNSELILRPKRFFVTVLLVKDFPTWITTHSLPLTFEKPLRGILEDSCNDDATSVIVILDQAWLTLSYCCLFYMKLLSFHQQKLNPQAFSVVIISSREGKSYTLKKSFKSSLNAFLLSPAFFHFSNIASK